MKKISYILTFGISFSLLGITNVCLAAPTPTDIEKFLTKNGWTTYEHKKPMANSGGDLSPLMYYPKNANVPACGLLNVQDGKINFMEILSPEPGEQYPHCIGINDSANFNMSGKKYFVFEYLDRDSRDETYERFFYAFKNQNSYVADEKLNSAFEGTLQGGGKTALKASEGIKIARTYHLKLSQPKLTLLSRDLIADGDGGFAVFKEKSSEVCTFVLDNGIQLTSYTSELFNQAGGCLDYVASSKLETSTKIFYLGMYNSLNKSKQLAIFSIGKKDPVVTAEKELVASAMKAGRNIDIKSLKGYIIDSVKN